MIYYSCIKSRRLVISVLGAETLGLADACDESISLKRYVKKITGQSINIKLLTDNETVFNFIIRSASTTKRRLMINIKAARQAYNEVTINDLIWIKRYYNLEDDMKKSKILPQLVAAIQSGKESTKYNNQLTAS